MMPFISISTILIIMNVVTSYRGFKDQFFYDRYSFIVDAVLVHKDYKRLMTSGFLHVNWTHLVFNMIALIFFSGGVESYLGPIKFILIYISGLLGGNLLSLFIHRFAGDYSSVGASGAINAVIFASIALFPGMDISLFFLPAIPGWLFGLIYVVISIYGIRSRSENVGHDAHLGGGLAGVLFAIILSPSILITNTFTIAVIALPAIAFIAFIVYKPQALLIDNLFYKNHHNYTVEDRYNLNKINKQKELDRLLEKIHKRGISSLSKKERANLKEYSK